MSVNALVTDALKNTNMSGLLGNYNGIKGDDLTLQNGTQLPETATEQEIFYNYQGSCMISRFF
jgi:hypothetical protein